MQAYIGQIQLFPYTHTPAYWLPCDGRQVSVRRYSILHHLLGYRFGGEGDTFHLPDYREHAPPGARYFISEIGLYPSEMVRPEGYLTCGSIILGPWHTPPGQWAACDGAVLKPAEWPDLFAAIGTAFGGDGVGSFALPSYAADAPPGSRYLIHAGIPHIEDPWM